MAFNSQWDGFELRAPALPYDRTERDLSDKPRLTDGFNLYIKTGGSLSRRPGTEAITPATSSFTRVDRLWVYETMETPANVYLVVSAYVSGSSNWQLFYYLIPTGAPNVWTPVSSYRDCNASTRAHEGVVAKGKLYIKGYPAGGSSEKLGTVILDGTGGTIAVRPWGILGPTEPARIKGAVTKITLDIDASTTAVIVADPSTFPAVPFVAQINYEQVNVTAGPTAMTYTVTRGYNDTTASPHSAGSPFIWRDWSSSDHIVTVNQFWRYAYAYKTITGHISNRSPEETNPDKLPSRTGPFFDQCPVITVSAHADTTNVPTIVIYRSTDGGGSYYKLAEVDNPGTGLFPTFEFTDDLLESGSVGGTYNDPIPDSVLDTQDVAPSLTSNSPPPTVLSPLVTGTDTPAASTPLAYYQGRIWFGIGNYVFFSANEELNSGIPEESFPSGTFGNFFKYQDQVANLERTTRALFAGTISTINAITGTTRDTFTSVPMYEQYGMALNHPRAITRFGESIAYLAHDYRIMILNSEGIRTISDPLSTDIVDAINAGGEIDIKYTADLDREWLVVASHDGGDSQQWVYDLKRAALEQRDFWFLPWNVPSTCLASGRISASSTQRYLISATNTGGPTKIAYLDNAGTSITDVTGSSTSNFAIRARFSLHRNPTGNHVNELRRPGMTSVVERVVLDRTKYAADTDPTFSPLFDTTSTNSFSALAYDEVPSRRPASEGYKTHNYHINRACDRFAFQLDKSGAERFELQNYAVIWQPESGA